VNSFGRGMPSAPSGRVSTKKPTTHTHRIRGDTLLGLLDDWLSGQDPDTPADLAQHTALPAGHWTGERAAADILSFARKGRAFASLDKLLIRQGSPQVLAGSALALAAALNAWSKITNTALAELIKTMIR